MHNEAAAAAHPPSPPTAQRASALRRVLGALAGLGILICAAAVSLGGGLAAALAGLGAATALRRRRGHRYTGLTGWLGATLGVAVAFVAFMVVMIVRAPSGSLETLRQQTITRQEQRPQRPPAWLRRYMPQTQPPPNVAAATNRFAESRPVFWWMVAMSLVLAGTLTGAFIGTIAWGGATLLLYGILGGWPAAARPAQQASTG